MRVRLVYYQVKDGSLLTDVSTSVSTSVNDLATKVRAAGVLRWPHANNHDNAAYSHLCL